MICHGFIIGFAPIGGLINFLFGSLLLLVVLMATVRLSSLLGFFGCSSYSLLILRFLGAFVHGEAFFIIMSLLLLLIKARPIQDESMYECTYVGLLKY